MTSVPNPGHSSHHDSMALLPRTSSLGFYCFLKYICCFIFLHVVHWIVQAARVGCEWDGHFPRLFGGYLRQIGFFTQVGKLYERWMLKNKILSFSTPQKLSREYLLYAMSAGANRTGVYQRAFCGMKDATIVGLGFNYLCYITATCHLRHLLRTRKNVLKHSG